MCVDDKRMGEIESMLDEATRGPWTWTQYKYGLPDLNGRAGEVDVYEYDTAVIEVEHSAGSCTRDCDLTLEISPANQALIAAAPTVIRELLDALKAATAG